MTLPGLSDGASSRWRRPAPRERLTIGPIAALLLGIGLLALGTSLQNTTLAIRGGLEGFGETTVGVMMSAYFAGFTIGSILWPGLIERTGHVRAFAAFASVASATALTHTIFVSPLGWTLLRIIAGLCYAGLIVVAESWLNAHALPAMRARILSIYGLVGMGAAGVGQLLLNAADPAGIMPLLLVSALMSLAVVPVTLSRSSGPPSARHGMAGQTPLERPSHDADPATGRSPGFRWLYRVSPLGTAGSFLAGLAMSAFWGMGPSFAQALGLDILQISAVMAAPMLGALALQWPLGWLADHGDRRIVIACTCFLTASISFAIAAFSGQPANLVLLTFLFGGFGIPIYALCIAHANDRIHGTRAVSTAGALLCLYGLGASIGPVAAGIIMDRIGPRGLFLYTGTLLLVLMIFALRRAARGQALTADQSCGGEQSFRHGHVIRNPSAAIPDDQAGNRHP